jgi:hypothetical protein
MDRPVTASNPTTKTNYVSHDRQTTVNKVDLLFDIDNSASMGDKQAYLEKAVPDLVTRLVRPNCFDDGTGNLVGPSTLGACPMGSTIEFAPVHDMHLGVISSSLGTRGGDLCQPGDMTQPFLGGAPAISAHNDDRGELIARAATGVFPANAESETTLPDTGGQSFLDWFPTGQGWADNQGKTPTDGIPQTTSPLAMPLSDPGVLESDFQALVTGVHAYGCGLESQLESWYRFLVQPDPYDSIVIQNSAATWQGVDATIIKQRHDFLRPDSLVAILVLSDENDSEIDARAYSGWAYHFMERNTAQPRGTSICATNPASPDCTSCAAMGNTAAKTDPSCLMNGGVYPSTTLQDWGYDPNLRHVHMKAKYGIDPQYPLQRYVLGLTSSTVPDRDHEYPPGAGSYQGGTAGDPSDLDCANPLFAATLPDGSDSSPAALCNKSAAPATRTKDLVFFAHIGGVPHQLLQVDPTNPDSPQKDSLSDADWQKILGRNPDAFDYTGIDTHMAEDYQPRPGLPFPTSASPNGGGPDPISGREWVTNTGPASAGGNAAVSTTPHADLPVDREYACIFPLTTPRDCSNTNDFVDHEACDCSTTGLPGQAVPAVCGLGSNGDYNQQLYAKAYPTIRELELAKMMGKNGIISSLCPIHTQDGGPHPELYGYRPAINAIVNRLKSALADQCLPQPLNVDMSGHAPCLVLATLPSASGNGEAACDNAAEGLGIPDASVLVPFQQEQHKAWLAARRPGVDPSTLPTCEVTQIPYVANGSCAKDPSNPGWCYVTGGLSTGKCAQAIQFTARTPPSGSTVTLQCIEAAQ